MSPQSRMREMLEGKIPRMPGRPPLVWTASQQRKLIRLIVDADVPWKDIDVAMEEPGFAPKSGNCRKQWKKMTKMNPGEVRVKDPAMKERRKQQAIRAFEAYQLREAEESPSTVHPLAIRGLAAHNEIPTDSDPIALLSAGGRKNDWYSKLTPNAFTVPPLSDAATPAESIPETETPRSFGYPFVQFEVSQEVSDSSVSPDRAQSPAQTFVLDGEGKRLAPFEFGTAVPTPTTSNPNSHLNLYQRPENMPARANEAPTSHKKTTKVQESTLNGHHVVSSEGIGQDESTALAKIEDGMSVPRGFINFFKYQLTIKRDSVASALSSSGSLSVPWLRKKSKRTQSGYAGTSYETGLEFITQQPLPEFQAEDQWTKIAPPMETDGRANTDLFWELQLAGSTDEEIASRLEALINAGANPNARGPEGETPLHVALRLGNRPACLILLEKGADKNVKSLDGKSLSRYGKIAQNRPGNNSSRYLAIKTCRYAIKEYDPRRKATAASKVAPKNILPLAGQKHAREQDGDESSGSRMKPPPVSVFENPEERQPLHTHESDFLPYQKRTPGVVPSGGGPFLNTSSNGWNTNNQTISAHNLDNHESATSRFNPDQHSTSGTPPIPYLDQNLFNSPVGKSPSVQKLVEQFDGRKSKPPSAFPSSQSNSLDGWHNQEPSQAYSYSATQNLHGAISQMPNTRPLGFDNAFRNTHASRALNGQSNPPVNPQQSLHAMRAGNGLPLERASDPASPTRLSGYLTELPSGQWALVCPLSTKATWQYAEQESNGGDHSLAAVKIISRPSTTVNHATTAEAGPSSSLAMSQGQIVPKPAMKATAAWTGLESHMHAPVAAPDSNLMESNARFQYASKNDYVEGWDFSRPGFNSWIH